MVVYLLCFSHSLQHCSSYDAQVAEWLWSNVGEGPPPMMTVPMELENSLRYGENPHQVTFDFRTVFAL